VRRRAGSRRLVDEIAILVIANLSRRKLPVFRSSLHPRHLSLAMFAFSNFLLLACVSILFRVGALEVKVQTCGVSEVQRVVPNERV
jgi:hypothetical protein